MKKLITILALVLLFTASTQAAVVLMDENFDSAADGVDLDTLSGWVNNGAGTIVTASPVDGSTMGAKGAGEDPFYNIAIANVTLAAGEYYRWETYVSIPGAGNEEMAHFQLTLSDGRLIQYVYDAGRTLTQDIYVDNIGWSRLSRQRLGISGSDVRLALDMGPSGVDSWYDNGSGWQSLGSAAVSVTGGIVDFQVRLTSNDAGAPLYGDTFSLVVLPEPATLAVLALGGFAVLLRRKR